MDQFKLAEFAKKSENKENPAVFTESVQEEGIAQGTLIVSRLFNTMLGETTRVMKSWNAELVKVLDAAGLTPTALSDEQLLSAFLTLIKKNSNGLQLGDLVPNIGTTSPLGRVLCNGQRLGNCKRIFPDFYDYVVKNTPYKTVAEWNAQVAKFGQCGFCAVDGDDVIVPLITRTISGVKDLSQCGQAVNDTMRAITGTMRMGGVNGGNIGYVMTGAFDKGDYRVGPGGGQDGDAWDADTSIFKLDSSRLGANYNGTETRGKCVQYPYYIQVYTGATSQGMADTAALVDLLKYQNQLGILPLPKGNTVNLASGGIYSGAVNSDVTFILPAVTDKSLLNQILIQLDISGDPKINWGTTNYFSGEPSTSAGNYNIIYEYDNLLNAWVVGQVEKVVL